MKVLNNEDLDNVNGGGGGLFGSGWYMTVSGCDGGYLALRPHPRWEPYNEIAQLWPGDKVYTYGDITNGIGVNDTACRYRKVCFNSIWGWADANYMY